MKIDILSEPFNPWSAVSAHQSGIDCGKHGACAVFVGTMRDVNEGDVVRSMRLEHYPEMTRQHLERIAQTAADRWKLLDLLLMHRVGEVTPGEAIVLVATWSAHRAAAYDANRFIMEDLKSSAPFWKKEQLADSSRWVEKNTSG